MTITIKTIDFQRAADELRQALKAYSSKRSALVGIHEDAGMVEDGSFTQAQNGAIQHFGTEDGHIPARPWLDVGVIAGYQVITEDIFDSIRSGLDLDTTIERAGLIAVGEVQQYITDLKTPPNAPYTIEKKGSDNPLIDSGSMRQSVTSTTTDEPLTEGL